MIEKVKRYIKQWNMLENDDRVIVGVSGGADSVCLLFVLSEIRKMIPFEMVVVHVNHGIRGEEADEDEAYVKKLCESLHLPLEIYSENVELIAKNRKQSTEEAGREVRRACFADTMNKYQGNKVALAHHKNDNAETLLFNLSRGTGLKGLGGMRPVQGEYIRPLLCVSRPEIEQYLKERAIFYCEDRTNATDEYTRNRIRNHVIPYLEQEVNSSAVSHIGETMAQLQLVQDFLEQAAGEAFATVVKEEDGIYVIEKEKFDCLHEAIRPLIVKQILINVAGEEKDIEQVHVQSVQQLLERQNGRHLDLPYQMEARRVYEGVRIQRKKDVEEREFSYEISLDDRNLHSLECNGVRFCWRILEKWEQKGGTYQFDCDIIQNGLTIRTRQPGDFITIHPDGRTQKLKSFFINEKIPQDKRDQLLLVADGSHILWIVGVRVGCAHQITSNTKRVLEIQVEKGV